RDTSSWADRRITFISFPADRDFSFLQLSQYQGWCVEHDRDDIPNNSTAQYNGLVHYSYWPSITLNHDATEYHGAGQMNFTAQQMCKVNYIINHRYTDPTLFEAVQRAIWTVLGQPAALPSDHPTQYNNLVNAANDPANANYTPPTDGKVGVIVQP